MAGCMIVRGGAVNRGFTYTEIIRQDGAGRTLLDHLARTRTHTPKEEWHQRIEAGAVLVDGARAAPDQLLRRGQSVEWARPPWEEPSAPLTFAVLFQDDDLLAVAKPSGLPTLPGGGYLDHTLLHLVRLRCAVAAPLHRLGRGTTGIALFARTREAARTVAMEWREGRVAKTYRALVAGRPREAAFSVDAPIGPLAHPLLGTVHAASPAGKPSSSEVTVLERREEGTLVEVRIRTGRPHQIRIHLAFCGHPLVGDPLYGPGGGFRDGGPALPGDTGYLLHALRLRLDHPRRETPLEVWCCPPVRLRSGAERLGSLATSKPGRTRSGD